MNSANIENSPRLQRVLRVLKDKKRHSTMAIAKAANVCAVNSIVAELRENGFDITCRQKVTSQGRRFYYQLQ